MSELEKVTLDALTRKMSELYVSYRKQYVLSKPDGSIFIPKRKGDLDVFIESYFKIRLKDTQRVVARQFGNADT